MARIYATKNMGVSDREQRNAIWSGEIAAQGMVLLKNDGTLPLNKENRKIALFGNGARCTIKGGTGSGDVNSRSVLTVEQALREAGFELTTTSWMNRYDKAINDAQNVFNLKAKSRLTTEGMGAIIDLINHPFQNPSVISATEEELNPTIKTALYILSRNSGEGSDRRDEKGDFQLYAQEEFLLDQITSHFEEVIIVLNVGGVVDTNYFFKNEKINALLLMSQAGTNGAKALVDILTGEVTPSGHLTATWAEKYEDYPCANTFGHRNGELDDEFYTEGIYVGYRYFDTFGVAPNYPFGYGMSYTSFSAKTLQVKANADKIELEVQVQNIGEQYAGREVVQVYYSAPEGKLEKPYQELAAFGKTKILKPGESEILKISFATKEMASYDTMTASWILEAGDYYIRVGRHSRSTQIVADVRLNETATVAKLENKLQIDEEFQEISSKEAIPYSYPSERKEKEQALILKILASEIACETVTYKEKAEELKNNYPMETITMEDVKNGKYTLEELAGQLTVEELAEICVGASRGGWGSQSIIGMASNAVPGAAGDTTATLLETRGIRNLILADGPAGLRLSEHFMADKEDNLIAGSDGIPIAGLDILAEMTPKPEIPEGAIDYYQYCTAIPIATLLAQTWDLRVIEEAGDLVGEEMEEFGVHLWLAPGMNIQRNPLCGRNFEYYSEDPLMSGKCAMADTKGVQKHKNCGTTIKHFACNNQEDNRMYTNAHVKERALREIYLKGFEIAIRESQPKSLMTSYNLLNGTHTANNYDLITAIARDEWGFKGFVMTDWGTTGGMADRVKEIKQKYGRSSAAGCIKAGNDLTMPGKQEDIDEIIQSVKGNECEYPVLLSELQSCAKRVLWAVCELIEC